MPPHTLAAHYRNMPITRVLLYMDQLDEQPKNRDYVTAQTLERNISSETASPVTLHNRSNLDFITHLPSRSKHFDIPKTP